MQRSCIQEAMMSTFSQLAYDHIRSKLVQGALETGDLSEPILARELGISRTPIREAIRQLESEGLLEQRAKQGTYIRRPDRHELEEIYQVRILLEPYAAGEAAQRCTAADLRDLQGLLRSMSDALAQSRLLSSEADRERLLQ